MSGDVEDSNARAGLSTREFLKTNKNAGVYSRFTNDVLLKLAEQAVINHERALLNAAGHTKLAELVEHSALLRGDQSGYQVSSFDFEGNQKRIVVKITSTLEDGFDISAEELSISQSPDIQFCLYHVAGFNPLSLSGTFVTYEGDLRTHFQLEPVSFSIQRHKG